MTDYREEIIKKAEDENAALLDAIQHAEVAIKDRNHLNYLDKLQITRWVKAVKEVEKTINALKK